MSVTRTFKVSGTATLAGIALVTLANAIGGNAFFMVIGALLLVFGVPVFSVSLTRHLLRGLLWRVGSRLLVSYALIGLFPLPFLLGMLYLGALMVTGQLGARRAETALGKRIAKVEELADTFATRLEYVSEKGASSRLFARALAEESELVGVGYALSTPSGVEGEGVLPAEKLLPRPWLKGGSLAYAVLEEKLVVLCSREAPSGQLVVYLPLDETLERALEKELGLGLEFQQATRRRRSDRRKGPPRRGISVETAGDKIDVEPIDGGGTEPDPPDPPAEGEPAATDEAASPAGPPPRNGPLHWRIAYGVSLGKSPLLDWTTGKAPEGRTFSLGVASSLATEFEKLFGRAGEGKNGSMPTGREMVEVFSKVLAILIGSVYLMAAGIAALLVSRIARATGRLSHGFSEIESGNFAFRAKLKGQDQLAGMILSFNRMAAHLQTSVRERAEKESLEHELSLARDLQRRLLPSSDFRFPGVEIAVDFKPAAAIGGDFYHFINEGPDRLVVVIADVSGHGLGTGIVMASAKASLSALASTGVATDELFTTLDREIVATTDKRSFVTLSHARLDLGAGRLELTNAGHLYPYRLETSGTVTSLPNPSRPLGLTLPATFRTVSGPLARGDVWVFMSDGIIEATNEADDPFGFGRVESILKASVGASALEVRDRILSAWREHTGTDEPEDDRTLLVVRVIGEEATAAPPPMAAPPAGVSRDGRDGTSS